MAENLFLTLVGDFPEVIGPRLQDLLQGNPISPFFLFNSLGVLSIPTSLSEATLKDAVYNAIGLGPYYIFDFFNFPQFFRQNIMKEIRPYLDEECSLQQIAEDLEITPHQLSQLINEHLGVNFNAYINRFRIDAACKMLLEEKNRSVLSIAYAIGFNSKSSFYEAFSKNMGLTPKDFRKQNS